MTDTQTMRERIARAMLKTTEQVSDGERHSVATYGDWADAALDALSEPTPEMVEITGFILAQWGYDECDENMEDMVREIMAFIVLAAKGGPDWLEDFKRKMDEAEQKGKDLAEYAIQTARSK